MTEKEAQTELIKETAERLKRFRSDLQHFKESFQILEDRVEDPESKKVVGAFISIANVRFLELTARVRKITEQLEKES